ncbi:MAG: aldehyde ferredoxin oxidoreductase N-terminal domain-containing protein [Candidatus Methanospirareceae archaeon]
MSLVASLHSPNWFKTSAFFLLSHEKHAGGAHAYAFVHEKYRILSAGASVGEGYGPVLVAKIRHVQRSTRRMQSKCIGCGNCQRACMMKRRFWVERREDLFEKDLGGVGVASQLLKEEYPKGDDPLSEENPIFFAVVPLMGYFPLTSKMVAMFLVLCSSSQTIQS